MLLFSPLCSSIYSFLRLISLSFLSPSPDPLPVSWSFFLSGPYLLLSASFFLLYQAFLGVVLSLL